MSGTEFLIQIQQQMTGDNPVTELQKTEQALKGAMDSYKELEKAAVGASKKLEAASAGVAAVRAKMQTAMDAGDASAFWKLAPALDKAVKKEKELADAAAKAKAALAQQESAVSELAAEYGKLKDKEPGPPIDVEKTAAGLKKLGGPLGGIGDKVEEFSESWNMLKGSLGTSGAVFAVATVAVVALVAAVAMAAVKVAQWAIGLANARRDMGLTIQAIYGTGEAATAIQGSFAGITRATGIASDRLLQITRDLKAAGVAAGDVPAALKAIAQQESALGDSSGTSALIEELKSGKKTVAELGQEMSKQYGDIAKKKAMGLDQQMVTLSENIADLFGGSNIEGFLAGVQRLVALFDGTTASGKALKAIFESFLAPLGGVEGIFITIERFILGAIASALKLGIAIKKVAAALGFDTSGLSGLVDAADVGKVALFTLLIPFAPIIAAIAAVIAIVYALVNTWQTLSAAASAIASAVTGAWESVSTFLSGIDLGTIGADLITGLADGIKNNAQKVIQAITGAVGDAIAQAKSLLKIASPSKVFEEMGGYTAEGFAEGVDGGAADAQDSMAAMVAPPQAQAAAPAAGGASLQIGDITIIVQGGQTNEETGANLRAELTRFFEELGFAVGARRTANA